MSDIFKKALGLFVEFDDTAATAKPTGNMPPPVMPQMQQVVTRPTYNGSLSQQDIDKFSKHFNDLFDRSNLPGPDYYEFSKMMHLLESQIPDENIRIATVFASLSIQGLTKEKIVESAKQYQDILENDKQQFEKAAADKSSAEVDGRKSKVDALEKQIADNSAEIQKLTQAITAAQSQIGSLKNEIVQEQTKIEANKGSFTVAFQAMDNKISSDIQKINTILK